MQVFIDGSAGTTGLQLEQRLSAIPGITLIKPDSQQRKDPAVRRACINRAEVAFLCLPDAAARESAAMLENADTVLIDASTAHRTAAGWAYGFPELSAEHAAAVRVANRIAVPGCHASGFCALVYPLVKGGWIAPDQFLYCHSLTGYSGGGKSMIADYERADAAKPVGGKIKSYALSLRHKHLPEMQHVCGLLHPPLFHPTVADVRQGMLVSVPLAAEAEPIWQYLSQYYQNTPTITVMPLSACETLDLEGLADTDAMEIYVFNGGGSTLLTARFDNLGKGASGAAVQCMKVRKNICQA